MITAKNPPCDRRWVDIRQTMRFWLKTNCVCLDYTIFSKGGEFNGR